MSLVVVGVGEFGVSNQPGETIRTYALGSCVGLVMFDARTHTAGLLHVALPESRINQAKAREKPGYFADTGIAALLREMQRLGCREPGSRLLVKMAGGANIMDPNDTFSIGRRNVLAIKKILTGLGILIMAEDVGGSFSRTMSVDVAGGSVKLSCPGRGEWSM